MLIPGIEAQPLAPFAYYLGFLPLILIVWGGLLSHFGMYRSFYISMRESLMIISKTAIVGFLLMGSYIFILRMHQQVSRLVIGYSFIFAAILLGIEKFFLNRMVDILKERNERFRSALIDFKRVLIVGTGKKARRFIEIAEKDAGAGINIVGLIDLDSETVGKTIKNHRVIGTLQDIPRIVHNDVIDEVVFVIPRSSLSQIEDTVKLLEDEGIRISLAADFFNLRIANIRYTPFHGFPLLTFETVPDRLGLLFIKRVVDFIISIILLLLFSPLFVIIFFLIRLTSKGPVLFKQERIGLNGRRFILYKFRTMEENAEERLKELLPFNEMKGPVFKMKNDPRVTRVGRWLRRFSLDELPQLWNVLKGDMSLVGPRPPLPEEVERYLPLQRRRLSMRPGITCLWQVSGRSKISDFNEWVRLDFEYIDNWSLKLDLKILLKSIPVVLQGKGAV